MSSTRRASKRDRLARRAENDQMRYARRETLLILLSRTQRGITLSAAEAGVLRVHVEAEIREGDDARTGERGQQRAMEQQRQRVDAAEAAIVEAEQRAEAAERMVGILDAIDEGRAHGARRIMNERDEWQQRAEQAEERLARIRDMADGWKRRLPATIRTATAAEAVRNAANGDYRPVMFAVTDAQADDATAWKQRALDAEEQLTAYRSVEEARKAGTFHDAVTRNPAMADVVKAYDQQKQRAEQAEESLRAAYQCSNDAEQARAEAEQRAEQAVIERAQWKAVAVGRRHRAEEAIRRADRFEAAWHSARNRARKRTAQRDRAEQALDRARIVGPQLEYDATAPGMAEAAREAFRDSSRRIRAALAEPEVITDRATIRNTLAEPEPCRRHPMCPCDNCTPTPAEEPTR